MAYGRSGDAVVYYEEYGGGPTLILLPGLLGTIDSTRRRFVPDLAAAFHVLVADLRGHGRTNNPAGVLTEVHTPADCRHPIQSLQRHPYSALLTSFFHTGEKPPTGS